MGPKEKRRSRGPGPERTTPASPPSVHPSVHPSVRQCAHSACGSPAHQRGGSCKYGVGGSPPLGAASPQRGLAVLPGAARASASRPGTRPPATQAAPVRKDQAARAACERRSKAGAGHRCGRTAPSAGDHGHCGPSPQLERRLSTPRRNHPPPSSAQSAAASAEPWGQGCRPAIGHAVHGGVTREGSRNASMARRVPRPA